MNSLISSGAESFDNFQNSTFLLIINPKLAGAPNTSSTYALFKEGNGNKWIGTINYVPGVIV